MSDNNSSSELPRLITTLLFVITVMFICTQPQGANDFWMQAKIGELILQDHAIPSTLLFPFTEVQTQHFNAHEWLPSILFHEIVTLVKVDGLGPVMGATGLVLFGLMAWLAYRKGDGNLPLALLLGLVAIGVENFRHTLRPELISLLLLAGLFHFLESFRLKPTLWSRAGAIATTVVWANSHGSFVLAPIIVAAYAAGTFLDSKRVTFEQNPAFGASPKAFAFLAGIVGLATLVTPTGLEQIQFVFSFSTSSNLLYEWLPTFSPGVMQLRGFWIAMGCAVITLSIVLWQWRKLSAVDALILLIFMVLAYKAVRFLVYLGMVAALVIPPLVAGLLGDPKYKNRLYGICVAFGVSILGLSMLFGNAQENYPHQNASSEKFTQQMTDALNDARVHGNVLNSAEYGAELVYLAYPRLRPSVDSRFDSYGYDYFSSQQDLLKNEKRLNEFIARYDVRYMLLSRHDVKTLADKQLSSIDNQWQIYSSDHKAVLLQRRGIM